MGALSQGGLQHVGLLVGHSQAGRPPLFVVFRAVQGAHGFELRGQSMGRQVFAGERVGDVRRRESLQNGLDGLPNVPRGQPVRGAVDRNRAGELGYVGLVFDEFIFRMGQLEAAAVRGDGPRKAGDDAGSQALGVEFKRARAFAEKGQIELVHAVGDADREDVATPRVHRPHP